jgi:hypothetical protein
VGLVYGCRTVPLFRTAAAEERGLVQGGRLGQPATDRIGDRLPVRRNDLAERLLVDDLGAVPWPPDANGDLDDVVDGLDFLAWNANKFMTGGAWSRVDLNADGVTDGLDFVLWNTFNFQSSGAPAFPDPHYVDRAFAFGVRRFIAALPKTSLDQRAIRGRYEGSDPNGTTGFLVRI